MNSLRAAVSYNVVVRNVRIRNDIHQLQNQLFRQARACSALSKSCHIKSITRNRLHGTDPISGNLTLKRFDAVDLICFNNRYLHLSRRCLSDKDSSKVEQTVKALKEKQEKETKSSEATSLQTEPPKDAVIAPPKRTLWKRIVDELRHYYHGFRLLYIDSKIAARLTLKAARGDDLTRREYRQLTRTAADIFRLVPFSVFIIVPFMELLLPVFIKFFPGMLPSTFETAKDKETKVKAQLKVKLEMTKFLQTTLDEMALQAKGETHSHSAKEFADFFVKIRKSGEIVRTEDILKFSKLFEDEFTLDSLTRPQLTALCRLLELKPIGPDALLRFQLRTQLRRLKADDKMIANEGITTLTVPELQQACRARGMRALGVPEDRLRTQLQQWLEMSLNEHIPPSLLLLSRILFLPDSIPAADQLKATLQSLPLEAATEAKYKIGETEGKIDNKTKLELIQQEEAAIKKEKEEAEKEKKAGVEKKKLAVAGKLIDKAETMLDQAIEVRENVVDTMKDKLNEKDKELSKEDMQSLEDALEQVESEKKSLVIEKEELQDIKEEMEDYKEDIEQFKEVSQQTGNKNLRESSAAKNLRKKVEKMVANLDKVVGGLESKNEVKVLQETIGDMIRGYGDVEQDSKPKKQFVNVNDLIMTLRKVGDEEKVQRMVDVLDLLDTDHDGNVEVDLVMKVIDFLTREDVKVTKEQVQDIVKLFNEEERLEVEEKKLKNSGKNSDVTK
ncbi:Mitochondrial proton/calcium exchanger protein [Halotydeus destructor]|nr:Mitochondrial proton/calcium exchanger protein [Halotydeus destructor]